MSLNACGKSHYTPKPNPSEVNQYLSALKSNQKKDSNTAEKLYNLIGAIIDKQSGTGFILSDGAERLFELKASNDTKCLQEVFSQLDSIKSLIDVFDSNTLPEEPKKEMHDSIDAAKDFINSKSTDPNDIKARELYAVRMGMDKSDANMIIRM
jgi:hypothetical protein